MPDVTRNPDENPDAKASRIRLPKAPPAREATPEPGTAASAPGSTPGTAPSAPGTAPAPEAAPAPNAGAPLKEAPVTPVTPVTPAAPDPTTAHGTSTTPATDATGAPAREGAFPAHEGAAPGHGSAVPGREGAVPGRDGALSGHETAIPGHETTAPSAHATATSTHGTATSAHSPAAPAHGAAASARETAGGGTLLPHDEGDKLEQRLHHAVAGFVDAPRESVEEADRVLEEVAARLADAVTHRRRSLRTSWQDAGADGAAASTDTEQLRLALRDYRELTDRLMRL
ncbi:hypothetical protein [Streptomyces parvulus]|uniref:hypothetical protein n=1 Tax=Streptomyces parvulus TaxID=146923 RepID=UPI0037A01BAA